MKKTGGETKAAACSVLRHVWHWVDKRSQQVFCFFAEQWKSVLFSAGIAGLLDHWGALHVLTKFSWLVVSSMAAQGPVEPIQLTPGMTAVVLIGNADYITRYGEKSPLDRCTLAGDIEKVLSKSPKRLAIDFDLSPLVKASDSEQQCQRELDKLLDREAGRLVLLVPFEAVTDDMLRTKHDWMLARCRRGLHFGDGNIEQSLGLVTEIAKGEGPDFEVRFANQLHSELSEHICTSVLASDDPHQNKWLTRKRWGLEVKAETVPINFREVTRNLAVLPISSSIFKETPSLDQSLVFLGGDWGRDDSFLTSIGELPGVVVHAARLISLDKPVEAFSPIVGLMSDIGIALCFAWVVQRFWHGYVRARRLDLEFKKSNRRTAFSALVMLTFLLIFLTLVLFFFYAAEYLFSERQIIIAPLLIAASILIDGFVSGPVEKITELLEGEESEEKGRETVDLNAPLGHEDRVLVTQVAGALLLIFLVTVLEMSKLIDARWWAGCIFMGVFVVLYVMLGMQVAKRILQLIPAWGVSAKKKVLEAPKELAHQPSGMTSALFGAGCRGLLQRWTWMSFMGLGRFLAGMRALAFWGAVLSAVWLVLPH